VASLAHRDDIAHGVGTTGTSPVHFPFTSENGIAASSVMAARFHGALAPSLGSFAYFVTECHCAAPFIRSIAVLLGVYLSHVSFLLADTSVYESETSNSPLCLL
jgi:hypothetical protein